MATTRTDQLIPIVGSPATAERVLSAFQSLPATGGAGQATASGARLTSGADAAGLQGALIGTLGSLSAGCGRAAAAGGGRVPQRPSAALPGRRHTCRRARAARPVTWQGLAMAQAAIAGPRDTREAALVAARLRIAAANHLDTEAIEPLLAYHASYALAGAPAAISAIDGLQKAMEAVPAAPATRVPLGSALAGPGRLDAARRVVLPVADGAYDSPERSATRALLARTGGALGAASPTVPQA